MVIIAQLLKRQHVVLLLGDDCVKIADVEKSIPKTPVDMGPEHFTELGARMTELLSITHSIHGTCPT